MNKKILIVENQFVEANYLRSMVEKPGCKYVVLAGLQQLQGTL